MTTRCIECDFTMDDAEWEAHSKTDEHVLNIKVNMVVRRMIAVGLTIEDLAKVLKKRKKIGSQAGEISSVLDVRQMGAMRAL